MARTRSMTTREANYIMHAMGGDPLIASYIDNQVRAGYNGLKVLAGLPLCPKCERACLHDRGNVVCPTCGYRGTVPQNHMIKHHINSGMFR